MCKPSSKRVLERQDLNGQKAKKQLFILFIVLKGAKK